MRLLQLQDDGNFSLVEFSGDKIPRYAILSHTWGADNEEITFQDMKNGRSRSKASYRKISFCEKQAKVDGLEYFWVDTCCIDKSSSQELSEAINSMFRWYKNAERCYVYLSDVSDSTSDGDGECTKRWKPAFKKSRWFTRGWTLQELIAPASVEFFSREGTCLGNKKSLEQTLHEITGIAVKALRGSHLSQFSTQERFSWAAKRNTNREEDAAYCLLGIFDICMPLLYSEGREKALARLEKQIRKTSKDEVSLLDEKQKGLLLDSLGFEQIHARQMTVKNAHAKTCQWLLENSKYLDWLDDAGLSEHHGFLWIKGKPGTGKSTLMKFALAYARDTMRNTIVISFFFNARGEDIEKSTIGTYRSLLLQLLERLPALQSVFDSLGLLASSISTEYQWSVESLKTLLEQAIQSLGESSVVCFIDALDECEEQQVREMIQFFEHIGELTASAGIGFRTCFSSRHYPHITIQKGLDLVLEGQEGHAQDIHNYLRSELKIGRSNIARQIRSELQEKALGVFMWVVLVVSILNKEHDRGRMHALRRKLQEIPSDLYTLFRDILTRESHNKDELVLCIQWVLFATQPLSPEQLYFAVLSKVEPEAVLMWDPSEITKDVIKRFILDSSKGLAEVTTSKLPTVQFIHESVRDFLLKENGLSNIWPELGSNLQGQSHERLKQCCVTQIRMDVFTPLEIPENLPESSSPQAAGLRKSAIHMFPFLEYAVQNVLHHADVAEGSGINQAHFVPSFPLPRWIKLDNLLRTREIRKRTDSVSFLYVFAEHNMPNLIKLLPSVTSCLEVENERYGPPFFAAYANGSKEVLKMFVQALAMDQLPESWPQYLYSQYHPEKFVQRTFWHDFRFSKKRGVLSYLAELGEETLFAILLKTGVSGINLKDQYGRIPLSWAAQNGHEAIVGLLLDTDKVDVDAKDTQYGQTPLSWAVQNGHEAIVGLLLDTDKVDVDAKDTQYGQTPLSWAVQKGHEAMVKLLLDTGKVDVDAKDSQYRQTPLCWAIQKGHDTIVKLLLDTRKVDVDAKDQYGRTPLCWVVQGGHEAMVKLLLDTGKVDVDLKDQHGRTPLFWAVYKGHEAMVKLLLDTGKVDVNAKDTQYGQTPLCWAAQKGHDAIVKLLLETGKVDVNPKDQYGRTPLCWAVQKGHEAIVKLLLDTGKVDVDVDNHYGQTPLWWAARNEHEAIVKLLLDTGKVNVNTKDTQYGQTPLWWAARNGHEAIVKLLQSHLHRS
jgi:ankyrin repeat protein